MNGEGKQLFPNFESQRLRLREPGPADAAGLLAITRDAEVMAYYGMEPFRNEDEARREIEWFQSLLAAGQGIRWCITVKPGDDYQGDIGFFNRVPAHARAEIGFKLARPLWRQGYMAELLPFVLGYGFEQLALNRLEALVDPRNQACSGLLEKFGFRREGLLREYEYEHGGFVDLTMYAMLKQEWRAP